MFKTVRRTRLPDEIAEQIKGLISEGKLRPGDRLPPERELVKEFNVSRPSLREALNSLATLGFLETRLKRTFVKSMTTDSIQDPLSLLIKTDTQKIFDLIEVRKALEAWAAFHAAGRASEEDLKRLKSAIDGMRAAFDEGRSWEKEDADFHLAIAQATHNTIQTHIMSTIYDLLKESVARVFRDRAKIKRLLQQHYRIFQAIRTQAPEEARERILDHLTYVEAEVKRSMTG